MAVTGKGKQIAGKSPPSACSSSGKRLNPSSTSKNAGGRRRKKRRSGVLQFFDDAADSDYEEEEEPESETEDMKIDVKNWSKAETRHPSVSGKSYTIPFFMKEEELSDDELVELIKQRYDRDSEFVVYAEDSKEYEEDSMKYPVIWRVKCMMGRERQIAFSLMQKFLDFHTFGTKLQIFSVFCVDHVKGYVYIEADKACDVTEACKGFTNLYPSKIGLVPNNEVPYLLSPRNKACEVSKDTWVRMKSGTYKGDLGWVVAVDEGRKRATVKLVPRIDLQAISKKFGGGEPLKKAAIPPPRLICSRELEGFGHLIESRRDRETGEVFQVLDGMMLKDGYLYKKVLVASLVYWGVTPSSAERLMFTEASKDEPDDMNWVSSVYVGHEKTQYPEASTGKTLVKQGGGFELHDLVLFGQKDFGVIIAVEKDFFKILKGDKGVPETVSVEPEKIKTGCPDKMFTASDHHMKTISINDRVKVLEGAHEGRQGIVRHMYKGTLFIHDKSQEENGGFICVQSKSCENMESTRSCDNMGGRPRSSMPQFSTFNQPDTTRSFSQHRQNDRDQMFSIGETLRIRKGPLKGYLCRVMGIYRSDVTVKLDSLVKVITVQGDFLCQPKSTRVASASIPAVTFGAQEFQAIGALSDEVRGTNVDKSSWGTDLPSFGSDTWQAFCTSALARDDDKKADEQGADPWGSKSASGARDQELGDGNAWGSKSACGARDQELDDNAWGSKSSSGARDQELGDDSAWGSKSASGAKESRVDNTWGSKDASGARDKQGAVDSWGSKRASEAREEELGADNAWGSKAASGARDHAPGADDAWGSKAVSGAREQQRSDDPWGTKVASDARDERQRAGDPWGSAVMPGGIGLSCSNPGYYVELFA